MTELEHLQSQRTMSQADVDKAERMHTAQYGTIYARTQHDEYAPSSH